MKQFSELNKQKPSKDETIKYDGYIKVISYDNWEFVDESSCVIIIPHILESDEYLVRKEYVPTYNYKEQDKEFFLTIVSGTIEETETPIQTAIRELREECGIKLNSTYSNFINIGEYYISKGNCAKYHILYIPLNKNEYTIVPITNDGSEAEDKSKTVRIEKKYINHLKASDTITALCFEKIMKI